MCCPGLCKCFLVVFNVIFLVMGAALLGGCIFLLVDENTLNALNVIGIDPNKLPIPTQVPDLTQHLPDIEVTTSYMRNIIIVLAAVGAFIVIVALIGCAGACTENKCLLTVYSIIVVVIVLAEFTATGLAIYFLADIEKFLDQQLKKQVQNHVRPYNSTDALTLAWNVVQSNFECCGSGSPEDYDHNKYQQAVGMKVPPSCCKDFDKENSENLSPEIMNCTATPITHHTTGCFDKLKTFVSMNAYIILGVSIGLAIIQIVCVVGACSVIRNDNGKM